MVPPENPPPPPDDNHDVVGWDAAPQGKDVPWHEPMAAPPRKVTPNWARYLVMAAVASLFCFLICVGTDRLIFDGPSRIATNETAAVQNLYAITTAQNQYMKKYDCYADSAWKLYQGGNLISAELAAAFEDFQSNGDNQNPTPKAGYMYRMLQGEAGSGPTSFRKTPNDPNAGLVTWGAICRTAEPDTTGENQFYTGEMATTYKFAEPSWNQAHYKQFLLDRLPAQGQNTWRTAK